MSAWFGMRPCGANLSIAWKHARQLGNQISRRHAGQTRQVVDSLRAERLMQLIRCDRLVLSRSDPRVDDVAVSALLKALQQAAEATKQAPVFRGGCWWTRRRRRRGRTAPEQISQSAPSRCTSGEKRGRRYHERFGEASSGNGGPEDIVEQSPDGFSTEAGPRP
jgi:hypothetical protein